MEDGERRIQISRDYSNGNMTQFSDKFPAELENLGIDEELFQSTITKVNSYFEEAETVLLLSLV